MSPQRYASGVRVQIRDAESRIKYIDQTSYDGELLTCERLSELVRGRETSFLTKSEPNISVLAPEDTVLVEDASSAYRVSRLYLATLIRQALQPPRQRISIASHDAPVDANHVRDTEQGTALGWGEPQHLTADDIVSKTYTNTIQSTDSIQCTIIYEAPFFKSYREEDYAIAWAVFELTH